MPPEQGRRLSAYWLAAATLLSLVCYYQLIYQTARYDFSGILVYFLVPAFVYLLVIRVVHQELLYWALAAAVLLRLALLPAVPELSDDFYRFIWDGRLLNQGLSPFAELPSALMQDPAFNQDPINQQLFQGMNSPDYFTVYPPLSQWIFFLASWLFPNSILGNIIAMRLVIILFEIGSIFLGLKILKKLGLPSNRVLVYAWNPLVVVELTGNLHFEAVMIFFVLLAVYWCQINRWKWSASALAAGVAAKLVPLIFLPLLMFRMPGKRVIGYWITSGLVTCLLFATIWSAELWEGMRSSLALYFQTFEFNASIYYLVREVVYAVNGYNIIHSAGPYLALATFIMILWLSWYTHKRMTWPQAMLWALTIFLLMSTTVHPWYVTSLVALAVFSNYRFPLAWSILIIISYAGYTESSYSENLWLVTVEYLLLAGVIILDVRRNLS